MSMAPRFNPDLSLRSHDSARDAVSRKAWIHLQSRSGSDGFTLKRFGEACLVSPKGALSGGRERIVAVSNLLLS